MLLVLSIGLAKHQAVWAQETPVSPEEATVTQEVDQGQTHAEQNPPPKPLDGDGPRYKVSKLTLAYGQDHPGLPSLEDLGQIEVDLLLTDQGYVVARDGLPALRVRIAEIGTDPGPLGQPWFYASAIRETAQALVTHLNSQGLIGVFVAPDSQDIEDGQDLRPEGQTSLGLIIQTVIVTESRTLGSGERMPAEERINNPIHNRIMDRSPVQPLAGNEGSPDNLLRRDLLDDYIFRLNRLPGRRVDVAVSRSQEPGGVVLDYLIFENQPTLAYFQVSNTGTEQTDQWRERFGLALSQLTDNDDAFSIDYVTSGFDESHSLIASYESPFGDDDTAKWRVFGSWGEFTATDVGAVKDQFKGDHWSLGGEVILNVFQRRELFVDLVVGARQEQIFVDNEATREKGREEFFLTYVGLNLERIVEVASSLVSVTVEWNHPGADQDVINRFGRTDPNTKWTLLKWNATHSFYLEPVVNHQAWADVTTPDTSTLAHEVAVSFKGQHAFDDRRLIPQMEQVAGGLYTVRGYEESATAGDTVLIASLEYRFHVPRAFDLQPNPSKTRLFGKPFRFAPQQVYSRPDWDLILKAFLDAAWVTQAQDVVGEHNERLVGTGLGVELQFQRNVNIQIDWGVALEETTQGIQDGSQQVHVVATILF